MHLTQFLQRPVVRVEREASALQVGVEMVHRPHGGLHLQEERRVVGLVLLQPPAGVGDGVVTALLVHLGQDGPEASGLLVQS